MAAKTADNFLQIPHNGAYGNKSNVIGVVADISTASLVALDTMDFVKIPAGATVVEGFLYTTVLTATATWALGVRYADGTSTGGTTGTAILVGGTASAFTGTKARFQLNFMPFTNDADTILYATHVSGPAATAGDNAVMSIDYIANGTK